MFLSSHLDILSHKLLHLKIVCTSRQNSFKDLLYHDNLNKWGRRGKDWEGEEGGGKKERERGGKGERRRGQEMLEAYLLLVF